MRMLQTIMVSLLLLTASIDELPVPAEETIFTAGFEAGDYDEWSLAVSEGVCLGVPLCEDSSPEWFCFQDLCGCVVECQVSREPVCNLRAAYCFGDSPPRAGTMDRVCSPVGEHFEEKAIERSGEQNSEARRQKAGI